VRVRAADPPGHVRTPHYTRGRCGTVESNAGAFGNPEELAYGRSGEPPVALYRVRFEQAALWPDYEGAARDTLVADIYEHWLEPAADATQRSGGGRQRTPKRGRGGRQAPSSGTGRAGRSEPRSRTGRTYAR
jgi:nitrile hydratase